MGQSPSSPVRRTSRNRHSTRSLPSTTNDRIATCLPGTSNIWNRDAAPYYFPSQPKANNGPRSLDLNAGKYVSNCSAPGAKANVYSSNGTGAAAAARIKSSWSDVASDMYRVSRTNRNNRDDVPQSASDYYVTEKDHRNKRQHPKFSCRDNKDFNSSQTYPLDWHHAVDNEDSVYAHNSIGGRRRHRRRELNQINELNESREVHHEIATSRPLIDEKALTSRRSYRKSNKRVNDELDARERLKHNTSLEALPTPPSFSVPIPRKEMHHRQFQADISSNTLRNDNCQQIRSVNENVQCEKMIIMSLRTELTTERQLRVDAEKTLETAQKQVKNLEEKLKLAQKESTEHENLLKIEFEKKIQKLEKELKLQKHQFDTTIDQIAAKIMRHVSRPRKEKSSLPQKISDKPKPECVINNNICRNNQEGISIPFRNHSAQSSSVQNAKQSCTSEHLAGLHVSHNPACCDNQSAISGLPASTNDFFDTPPSEAAGEALCSRPVSFNFDALTAPFNQPINFVADYLPPWPNISHDACISVKFNERSPVTSASTTLDFNKPELLGSPSVALVHQCLEKFDVSRANNNMMIMVDDPDLFTSPSDEIRDFAKLSEETVNNIRNSLYLLDHDSLETLIGDEVNQKQVVTETSHDNNITNTVNGLSGSHRPTVNGCYSQVVNGSTTATSFQKKNHVVACVYDMQVPNARDAILSSFLAKSNSKASKIAALTNDDGYSSLSSQPDTIKLLLTTSAASRDVKSSSNESSPTSMNDDGCCEMNECDKSLKYIDFEGSKIIQANSMISMNSSILSLEAGEALYTDRISLNGELLIGNEENLFNNNLTSIVTNFNDQAVVVQNKFISNDIKRLKRSLSDSSAFPLQTSTKVQLGSTWFNFNRYKGSSKLYNQKWHSLPEINRNISKTVSNNRIQGLEISNMHYYMLCPPVTDDLVSLPIPEGFIHDAVAPMNGESQANSFASTTINTNKLYSKSKFKSSKFSRLRDVEAFKAGRIRKSHSSSSSEVSESSGATSVGSATVDLLLNQLKPKDPNNFRAVVRYCGQQFRPSILRSRAIFGRFGNAERVALAAFDFLHELSDDECIHRRDVNKTKAANQKAAASSNQNGAKMGGRTLSATELELRSSTTTAADDAFQVARSRFERLSSSSASSTSSVRSNASSTSSLQLSDLSSVSIQDSTSSSATEQQYLSYGYSHCNDVVVCDQNQYDQRSPEFDRAARNLNLLIVEQNNNNNTSFSSGSSLSFHCNA